ncbi:MAG TPA: hypothetical protein VHG52_08020 [Thermomicrobiales bacterium]|nr:hypothetical protein [Thermomicrobiales bacterium]
MASACTPLSQIAASLAALMTIALTACDTSAPTPSTSTPGVAPSAVDFPTAIATSLPAGASETAGMRLFGSDDWLYAYLVPDSDGEVGQYCIQFVGASKTETTCEPLGDGDLTIVQGQSERVRYIAVIDPQGRIERVEVQAGGCRWANVGLESGHVSWVEFLSDPVDRVAVLGADGIVLEGEALPPNLPGPEACTAP